jgi:hypothetical protein
MRGAAEDGGDEEVKERQRREGCGKVEQIRRHHRRDAEGDKEEHHVHRREVGHLQAQPLNFCGEVALLKCVAIQ